MISQHNTTKSNSIRILLVFTVFAACSLFFATPLFSARGIIFDNKPTLFKSYFTSVATDFQDSGYVVGGFWSSGFLGNQGIVQKFGPNGQIKWGASFGDAQDQFINGVGATSDKGAIAAGYAVHPSDHATYDYILIKYDSLGNEEWSMTEGQGDGDDYIFDVQQAEDGGYVLAGFLNQTPFDGQDQDYYVVKTDANGNEQWTQTWSNSIYDDLWAIRTTFDGGYVVVGTKGDASGTTLSNYVAKLSSSGSIEWEYINPPSGWQKATGIRQLPDSSFAVCGYAEENGNPGAIELIRLDSQGSLLWRKTYTTPNNQVVEDVELVCDGGFALVGTDFSQQNNLSGDVFVLRADANGNELWHDVYGLNNIDYGRAAAFGLNGGVVVAGSRDQIITPFSAFYPWLLEVRDDARRFVVLAGDSTPMVGKAVDVKKLTSSAPLWKDTLLYVDTTADDGSICVCESMLKKTDRFKLSKKLHSEPSTRQAPLIFTKYSVAVDNMNLLQNGQVDFDTLTDDREQEVILDHTEIGLDLTVSIEWNTRDGYRNTLQDGFRNLSNYLYDVTDAQVYIDTVAILDNKVFWDEADIHIHANNTEWPHATKAGIDDLPPAALDFPRRFFGVVDDNRNLSFTEYPYQLDAVSNFRTIGHELGHYALGFSDEYTFSFGAGKCSSVSLFGYMESQYLGSGPMSSEMSSSLQYSDVACQNTSQYGENGASCWDKLEQNFQKTYGKDTIFADIIKPTERTLLSGNLYQVGPNENFGALDYDVGKRAVFSEPDLEATTSNKIVTAKRKNSNLALKKIAVNLRKSGGDIIEQGLTSDPGKIRVLDVAPGDKIRAVGRARLTIAKSRSLQDSWLFGEALVDGAGRSAFGNNYVAAGDDIDLELNSVQGNHQFIVDFTLNNSDANYKLYVNAPLPQSPTIEQHASNGVTTTYGSLFTNNTYSSLINNALATDGEFTILSEDDSLAPFFVSTNYVAANPLTGKILFAPEGVASFTRDLSTPAIDKAAIVSSAYPVLRNGLSDDNLQAGVAIALALYPDASLSGQSAIMIRYQDSDLDSLSRSAGDEASLRIFHWNTASSLWSLVGGSVDTVHNEVTGLITSGGVYAAFTTPGSPCGDFDASGQVNVADVVHLINYIFVSGATPQDASHGDVDCSGQVNISDAVYMINYIFVSGAAPCAACK